MNDLIIHFFGGEQWGEWREWMEGGEQWGEWREWMEGGGGGSRGGSWGCRVHLPAPQGSGSAPPGAIPVINLILKKKSGTHNKRLHDRKLGAGSAESV